MEAACEEEPGGWLAVPLAGEAALELALAKPRPYPTPSALRALTFIQSVAGGDDDRGQQRATEHDAKAAVRQGAAAMEAATARIATKEGDQGLAGEHGLCVTTELM